MKLMKHVSADQVKKDVSNVQHGKKAGAGFLAVSVLATSLILQPGCSKPVAQQPTAQQPTVEFKRNAIVSEGESVFTSRDDSTESSSRLRVVKIDDKGIELKYEAVIFMSEFATGKVRVNYGEPYTMEKGPSLIIEAEKGPSKGTALVTVSPNV